MPPSVILPFLDLYTLLILNPEPLVGAEIPTLISHHFPSSKGQFRPPTTRLAEAKAVRIFDPIDVVTNDPPVSLGIIPLAPKDEDYEFERQFYWRLPIHTEVVLSVVLSQSFNRALDCLEIDLLRMIHGTLLYRQGACCRPGRPGRRGRGGAGHRGGKSRTLEKGEPQTKKPRMESPQALDEEHGLRSLRPDNQSRGCSNLISYFFDGSNQ